MSKKQKKFMQGTNWKKNSCIAKEPEKNILQGQPMRLCIHITQFVKNMPVVGSFLPTTLPVIPIKLPPKVPSGISFYFFLVTTKLWALLQAE